MGTANKEMFLYCFRNVKENNTQLYRLADHMVIFQLVLGVDREHSEYEVEVPLWWKPLVLHGVTGDLELETSELPEGGRHTYASTAQISCNVWNLLVVKP